MALCVLVIDDNPVNLKLASEVLEFEGYKVAKAVDAESALELIKNSQPDLILMDIGLPGMDGLTLTKKLKANDLTKHILIIALTAFAMKADESKAIEAGCDGYMAKPINTRTLPKQIAKILENKLKNNAQQVAEALSK